MWKNIKHLLGFVNKADDQKKLHLATVALLVHVSLQDEVFNIEEKAQIIECLNSEFGLSGGRAIKIMNQAQEDAGNVIDLNRATSVITSELDQEGRKDIVRLLWQVAYADKHIDKFEDNIISKIADLFSITTSDRIKIKQEVLNTSVK